MVIHADTISTLVVFFLNNIWSVHARGGVIPIIVTVKGVLLRLFNDNFINHKYRIMILCGMLMRFEGDYHIHQRTALEVKCTN